jgi:hypothetical protein
MIEVQRDCAVRLGFGPRGQGRFFAIGLRQVVAIASRQLCFVDDTPPAAVAFKTLSHQLQRRVAL